MNIINYPVGVIQRFSWTCCENRYESRQVQENRNFQLITVITKQYIQAQQSLLYTQHITESDIHHIKQMNGTSNQEVESGPRMLKQQNMKRAIHNPKTKYSSNATPSSHSVGAHSITGLHFKDASGDFGCHPLTQRSISFLYTQMSINRISYNSLTSINKLTLGTQKASPNGRAHLMSFWLHVIMWVTC